MYSLGQVAVMNPSGTVYKEMSIDIPTVLFGDAIVK